MSNDRVVRVALVGAVPESVAVLSLFMALTRLVFVSESFVVFVAEESGPMTFPILQSRVRSGHSCVCVGDEAVAGEADPDRRLLSDLP